MEGGKPGYTSSTHFKTSSWSLADQCFLKYPIFSFGLRTRNISATSRVQDRGENSYSSTWYMQGIWSSSRSTRWSLTCSMKGEGKGLKFWMASPTEPCSVKGFQCRNCTMKSRDIVRWKCLLTIIGMLKNVKLQFMYIIVDIHLANPEIYSPAPTHQL